jgi:hypothetical protein
MGRIAVATTNVVWRNRESVCSVHTLSFQVLVNNYMHVFISTIQDDIHAALVAVALRKLGHSCTLWITQTLPEISSISITIDKHVTLCVGDSAGPHRLNADAIDIFWNRRTRDTNICADMHPADKLASEQACDRLLRSLLSAIPGKVFTVNAANAARAAEDKVGQIVAALRVGFKVPRSLFGGTPKEVRSFIASCTNGAIVKPLIPFAWMTLDGNTAMAITTRVTADELPSDEMLQLSPAIFQEEVAKSKELRVNVFGCTVIAASLASQKNQAIVDGRHVPFSDLGPELFQLPKEIETACVAITTELGLVFAALDIILTPTGEFVFLELNQMGQFLYLEEANESLCLLQLFCDFLISQDHSFSGAMRKGEITFHSFVDEARFILKNEPIVSEQKRISKLVLSD